MNFNNQFLIVRQSRSIRSRRICSRRDRSMVRRLDRRHLVYMWWCRWCIRRCCLSILACNCMFRYIHIFRVRVHCTEGHCRLCCKSRCRIRNICPKLFAPMSQTDESFDGNDESYLAIFLTCADTALTLSPAGADFFLIVGGGRVGAVGVEVFVAFVVDVAFAHVSNFVARTFALTAARIITTSSTCKLLSLLSSI